MVWQLDNNLDVVPGDRRVIKTTPISPSTDEWESGTGGVSADSCPAVLQCFSR
ncbi:MAG TPA: hypothetical protein VGO47_01725 [Chlamydiales bacterium]|nr:hypothetical protein [Chlamydiales bacterium]